ncbi:MAG TPA: gluconate 2-dehydrogenase subunit 3 family protein [Gemmatimonadaceae bacterium]|nr:gluconate 2-dehydrogenase subunit 3 family protein [Gemmatimonadaceae bacterium]
MTAPARTKTTLDRREAVKALALIPFAFTFDLSAPQTARATRAMADLAAAPDTYTPKFFKASEWKTVRMLADYIIPRDERSGSATEAKVPEYIDFLMADKDASESTRIAMRGGLGWLDFECIERYGKNFVNSTDAQRRRVLDDIAWPKKARPEMSHGVAFFNRFRDLTAGGFFSSEMGWKDVRYVGNVFNPGWSGCPPAALAKLGVTGNEMKTRVPVE